MLLWLIACFQIDSEEWESWEDKYSTDTEQTEETEEENAAPTVSDVEISPNETVYNDMELSCSATAEDPEGEEVSLSFAWMNNGEQFSTGETVDLNGQGVSPNQEISCVVTAEDSQGATGSEEALITIANRDPKITSIIISNEEPEANAELNCSAQASDDDGEEVSLSYLWKINEDEVGFEADITLVPDSAPVGATVSCTVSASDQSGGETIEAEEVIVQNTAPQIDTEAEINASGAINTAAILGCSAEGSDLNDGELEVGYLWTKNGGTTIGTGELIQLDSSKALPDDIVKCTAGVQDAQGETASSFAVVTIENAPPSFTQMAQISPNTGVITGTELICSAVAEDPEQGSLTPLYSWEVNGSLVGNGASFIVNASQTNVGDQITCTAEVTDSEGEDDTSIASVTIENTAPIVDSVQLSTANPRVEDEVTCTPSITNIDGDSLTITFSWEIGGSIVPNETSAAIQLSPLMISIGDVLTCNVNISDPAGESDSGSASETIQNTPPTITQPVITPNSAVDTQSTLTCSATGADVDDGAISPTFTWMNGTENIGSGPSIILDSTLVLPSDTIDCIALVTDNNGAFVEAMTSVSVQNALPEFTSPATISSASGVYTNEELTCTATIMDSEDGEIFPSFVWNVEGVEVATGPTYTISAEESDVGNTVACVVTVEDSHGGIRNSVNTAIIENTAPTVTSLEILPATVYNDAGVLCDLEGDDVDLDAVTVTYTWSADGVELGYASVLNLDTTALLPSDILVCEILATDTHGDSVQDSISITIENRAPSTPVVSVSWPSNKIYPQSSEDVTCLATADDPDGENLTYSFSWTSNFGATVSGPVLPASETSVEDLWTCTVTASDSSLSSSATITGTIRNCNLTDCDVNLDLGGVESLDFVLISNGVIPSGGYTISSDFYMMTTEVTQGMFLQLMGYDSHDGKPTSGGSGSFGVGPNYPAYWVSWNMAADFANQATVQHNALYGTSLSQCYVCSNSLTENASCNEAMDPYFCDGYRLPTEGEWEYASRAGANAHFWTEDGGGASSNDTGCSGIETIMDGVTNPDLRDFTWYCGNNNVGNQPYGSKEVATKLANGNRLYDMHGNIVEWTADWSGCNYPNPTVDPFCGTSTANRITRGGGWNGTPQVLRNAHRTSNGITARTQVSGFRLVLGQ